MDSGLMKRSLLWPLVLALAACGSPDVPSPTPDVETPTAQPPTPANLTASATTLDFGDVTLGFNGELELRLSSTTETSVILGEPQLASSAGDVFSLADGSPLVKGAELIGGDVLVTTVIFQPQAARGYSATLTIPSNDPDSPLTIILLGAGIPSSGADADGDTYIATEDGGTDCDDTDATIYPGAADVACDTIDQDCSGKDSTDGDDDGYPGCGTTRPDCDDTNPDINVGAAEVPYDEVDQDCDGEDLIDVDQDGYPAEAAGGTDCDDNDINTYPGATEFEDGQDNDCDGDTDESADSIDDDGDGFSEAEGDCSDDSSLDPAAPDRNPDAEEIPYDGIDQDCTGADLVDVDEDGYASNQVAGGADCNDTIALIYPGAPDAACDGVDQDCSGRDETDGDLDGYPGCGVDSPDCADTNPSIHPNAEEIPYDTVDQDCSGADLTDVDGDGYVGVPVGGDDCNDSNANIYPGATEMGDGLDNDCDGSVDEGLSTTDDDKDGFSEAQGDCSDDVNTDPNAPQRHPGATEVAYDGIDQDCNGTDLSDVDGDGYKSDTVSGGTDCNDGDAAIKPGAQEVACDGIDQNCTAGDLEDRDGDGFAGCTGDADCNDDNKAINPDAIELCDGIDNNCNGQTDTDAVNKKTYYSDTDGDGYGDPNTAVDSCQGGDGLVTNGNDCDDTSASTYLGAPEVCNGKDDDCDQQIDDGVLSTYYKDADGDTYGSVSAPVYACARPSGYVTNSQDCNDTSAQVNPGATEVCNTIDDDCDATIDEGVSSTFYQDQDGDGYGGVSAASITGCTKPAGYATSNTDCNDSKASINPGAAETCNGVDDNCSVTIDEGVTIALYTDGDGDGYGAQTTVNACAGASGTSANNLDCDDADPEINPTATDVPLDDIDQNCDGADAGCTAHGTFTLHTNVDSSSTTAGYMPDIAYDRSMNPHVVHYDQTNGDLRYGRLVSGTWYVAAIDTFNNTGLYPSIALASDDTPHVSWYDSSAQDLKYASFQSGFWTITTLDSTGNVGGYPDIKLDKNNRPVIAYYDTSNNDLKLATYSGTQWTTSTIDSSGAVGEWPSLAIDGSGGYHIAYFDRSNADLKYAYKAASATTWTFTQVSTSTSVGYYPRLVLDSTGLPLILFYNASNTSLRLARFNGTSWSESFVREWTNPGYTNARPFDLAIGAHGELYASYYAVSGLKLAVFNDPYTQLGKNVWWEGFVDATSNAGYDTAIAIAPNGRVGVAYWYYNSHDLRVSEYDPAGTYGTGHTFWNTTLDYAVYSQHLSVTTDNDGLPVIAYWDSTNNDLKIASYGASGWILQTAESPGSTGQYPSIKVDSNGYFHIAFHDASNLDLRYATNLLGYWTSNAVDTNGNVGLYPELVLDTTNTPHIAYHDSSNGDVKYAKRTSVGWSIATVDTNGTVGETLSMDLDTSGAPIIAYFDSTNADLKVARLSGSTWSTAAVDSTGNVGYLPSVRVSGEGVIGIAYVDRTSYYRLKYSTLSNGSWTNMVAFELASQHVASSPDLEFSGGIPLISSIRYSNGALQLSYGIGTNWSTTAISEPSSTTSNYHWQSMTTSICDEPIIAYSRYDGYVGGNYFLSLQTF